ncbi:hypothetical protein C9993_04170 [Marinobacter sp. Z-F4-2]|nr:hypothetical protein C9993_04170 [Marinobacter sp. Z-F4-2]
MSVYNGEEYLSKSIDSILKQSFTNFEFIIINDGSNDNSEEIIKSYCDPRIIYISNEANLGLISSLNKGLALARGKYIARQDADDISLRNRIEKQVKHLEENSETAVVGSHIRYIDEKQNHIGSLEYPVTRNSNKWQLFFNSTICHSAALYRKSLALKLGGYSKEYKYAEDYELWSRISRCSGIENLSDTLQLYRIHNGAISSKRHQQQLEVRRRIANENIKYFLEEKGNLEEYSALLPGSYVTSANLARTYLQSLISLQSIFCQSVSLCETDKQFIEQWILSDILRLRKNLNLKNSIQFLVENHDCLPKLVWRKSNLLKFLLSDSLINALKTILGKSSTKGNRRLKS